MTGRQVTSEKKCAPSVVICALEEMGGGGEGGSGSAWGRRVPTASAVTQIPCFSEQRRALVSLSLGSAEATPRISF